MRRNLGDIWRLGKFSGVATKTLDLPKPLTAWELRTTPAEIVAEVDRLTDRYTDKQIVEILNQRGTLSGCAQRFNSRIVARLRRENISSRVRQQQVSEEERVKGLEFGLSREARR